MGFHTFFVIHLVDSFLTKISGLVTKLASFFQPSSRLTLILFALRYCIASFGGVSFSHSQMCDPTRRKTCRTHYFFSEKHFLHFSEPIFCSIHHLTCLHHHGGNRLRQNGSESRVLSCFQFGWTYNFHLFSRIYANELKYKEKNYAHSKMYMSMYKPL